MYTVPYLCLDFSNEFCFMECLCVGVVSLVYYTLESPMVDVLYMYMSLTNSLEGS